GGDRHRPTWRRHWAGRDPRAGSAARISAKHALQEAAMNQLNTTGHQVWHVEELVCWTARERLRFLWYRLRMTVHEMNRTARRMAGLRGRLPGQRCRTRGEVLVGGGPPQAQREPGIAACVPVGWDTPRAHRHRAVAISPTGPAWVRAAIPT